MFEPELVLALTAAIINHERAKGGRTDPKGEKKVVRVLSNKDKEIWRFAENRMNLLLCGDTYIEAMAGGGAVENREIRQVGL